MNQDCVECKKSTHFGSGRFVNRVPADNGGYLCAECQMIECEDCGLMVLDDYEIVDGVFVCGSCHDGVWSDDE